MPRLVRSLAVLLLALAAPAALILAVPTDDAAPIEEVSSADDNVATTENDPSDAAMKEETAENTGPLESAPAESDQGLVERIPPVVDDETAAPGAPAVESDKETAELAPAEEETKQPAPVPLKPTATDTSAAAPADGKYRLEYKFKPGEVVRWEVVHRAVVDSTIQGTNQTAESRSTSIKMWTVTDVSADGQFTLVHSIESIDMWQKNQGRQEERYNSRTDENVPSLYQETAAAVGVPLTVVTIDRHGEVLKREEKHRQSNTNNMPLAIPLPAEAVEVGYDWSVPLDVDVMLTAGTTRKIQTKQKFKLEKVSDGLATIVMETQVLTPLNDPAIEAQLVQRMTNGTLKFDLERGRVVSQQLDLDRKVVGFSGASSSMHYVTRFTEELLPASTPPVAKAAKQPTAPPIVTAKALAQPPSNVTKKPTPPSAAAAVKKPAAPPAAASKAATAPPATAAKKPVSPPANTVKAPPAPPVATAKKPTPPPASAVKKPTPPSAPSARKAVPSPATAAKKPAPGQVPAGKPLKQPTSAWKPPTPPAQQPATAKKPTTPTLQQPTR